MSGTNSKSIGKLLAGAAFLLLGSVGVAGCVDVTDESGSAASAGQDDRGLPWVYGDLPTGGPDPKRNLTFKPKYYAVVYLKFDADAHLDARHTYFHRIQGDGTPSFEEDEFVACAIKYLRDQIIEEPCVPFGSLQGDGVPLTVHEDFENFSFGSQQRVYVFVDNENVAFNKYPLSFAPFGADDQPVRGGPETRERNLSFYHAVAREFPGSSRKGLLYFENYFRGKEGGEIKSTVDDAKFSINFNLLLCRESGKTCTFADSKQVIPLAIDPDTGNGWGSRPLHAD